VPRSNKKKILPNGGDPLDTLPFFDDGGDDGLDRVIAKLGDGDYQLKIYRLESYGWSFSFEQTGTDLNEEAIREEYGPGRYKIRVFKDEELVHVQNLNISKKLSVAELPNAGAANQNMLMMMEMFRQQNANLVEIIKAQGSRSSDGPTMNEIADTMLKLKQLNGGDGGTMGPEKVMELIQKGMEFAREVGPQKEESFGSQLLGAVKEALPMLLAGPGKMQHQLAAGSPPQSEEEMKQAREAMLRQGIEYLKTKSLGGSDPDLYVGMILDNMGNPLYRSVLDWVMGTEWDQIVVFDPELGKAPHEQFFRAIYDGLRQELGGQNQVVSDSGGPRGNVSNTPHNAGAGVGRVAKSSGHKTGT
jgi:hypothetical protein